MSYAYYIELPLEFPEGAHFGAGKQFNSLAVARDGSNAPVLNGSSFAGVMRSIWTDYTARRLFDLSGKSVYDIARARSDTKVQRSVATLFGMAHDDRAPSDDRAHRDEDNSAPKDQSSCVKVTNYALKLGAQEVSERTHHLRDRHRGTVVKGALFGVESCPPGTTATAGFWIHDLGLATSDDIEEFVEVVVAAFQSGCYVGGNSNRGIGRAVVNPAHVRTRRFDLTRLDQQAAQLDAHRKWRLGQPLDDLQPYDAPPEPRGKKSELVVELTLEIPRGQDMLVADGRADDVQMEPQRIGNADGMDRWRLPGSSLRGLFRRWFHRLAAREQLAASPQQQPSLADAAHDYESRLKDRSYNGEGLGWCFQKDDREEGFEVPESWPVASLFGSCFHPGRIKISDGYAPCSRNKLADCPECQTRMHVAVDRVTGGAAEGMLFDNRVLVANGRSVEFPVRITITDPRDHEIRWLAQTLTAIHIGVLRIGSSKSSGRLALAHLPDARGPKSESLRPLLEKLFS